MAESEHKIAMQNKHKGWQLHIENWGQRDLTMMAYSRENNKDLGLSYLVNYLNLQSS